jgi:two-component system, OmpR family, sensor kinase
MPIRLRLTLVFSGVMALVLAGTGLFVYLRVSSSLQHAVDQSLRARADDVAGLLTSGRHDRADLAGSEGFAQLLGSDGNVLLSSPRLQGRRLLSGPQLAQARRRPIFVERRAPAGFGSHSWRLLAKPVTTPSGTAVAVVAESLQSRDETLDHLVVQLLLGGAAALLLASLAGYALAAAALRPVEAMSRKAAEIWLKGEDRRLPVPEANDEIAHLGERLNEMLARIETAVAHERRFLAEASHELRTPLTIMRGELELALRRKRSSDELEEALRTTKEETDRLAALAEDLLVVARADQDALPVRRAPVLARELMDTVAARFDPRAAAEGRRIVTRRPPALTVPCDRGRIEQALGNLVDNALHHGAGTIELAARERDGWIELHVTDGGHGFPEPFLPHAFERFSRANGARSSNGTGLGLAIVEAIAHAHGGRAGAANRASGGSDVWLALPKEAA